MMDYYQISIPKPQSEEKTEILIAELSLLGIESFEEQEDKLICFVGVEEYNKEELLTNEYFAECERSGKIDLQVLEDKNWNEVWESNYPPVFVDNRCYVRAPFHPEDPSFEYEIVIIPKMAFGTGHHQTTSMILEYILEKEMKGLRVLDMGCGSGVLAILASMKGADDLVAVDIDPWSYNNTIENCKENEIENISTFLDGAEILEKHGSFDMVLANINKNILLRDMKYYSDALLSGGTLITSGYYLDDLEDIKKCALKYGIEFIGNKAKDNWVAGIFRKTK